jgi:phosphoglycolate phosphatase
MAIKGILFDKDGTLLDYVATWMPANRAAALAAARGDAALAERLLVASGYDPHSGRVAANAPLAAATNAQIAELWLGHLTGWSAEELLALIDRTFEDVSGAQAMPVTELVPLFARLRGRGLRLGLATSDSRRGVDATLGRFGILDLLDYVAGYDSGHGVKPAPGMVHGFCAATGLAPGEVAVVGDNLHDLEMGRRAGAGLVVAVLSGTGAYADLAVHADHVLDSIAALEALLDTL